MLVLELQSQRAEMHTSSQGDLQFRDFRARDDRFVLTDLNIISMGFTNHKYTAGLHGICNALHKDFTHMIKYCH